MSWECRYKVNDDCRKLRGRCDPGRKGCVLYGKVYFPFAPEKNPPSMEHPAPNHEGPTQGESPDKHDESDTSLDT